MASIQKLPAASVLTDINFPMKGRKGMVDWARNSEDRVVIPKNIFTPMSTGKEAQQPGPWLAASAGELRMLGSRTAAWSRSCYLSPLLKEAESIPEGHDEA